MSLEHRSGSGRLGGLLILLLLDLALVAIEPVLSPLGY
jgi:hypothetical protein